MGKGLSITAFVLSFIFPIVGLVLGIIAVVKAKDDPDALKGLAIAAIVIGGVFTLIFLVIIFSVGYLWFAVANPTNLAGNQLQLSAPLAAKGISYNSLDKQIEFQFINGDSDKIHVSSVSVDGCDLGTNNNVGWDVQPGLLATVKVSCPSLNNEKIMSAVQITYTTGTSSINQVVFGTFVVSIN